jgi:adenosylcobinamide-GDP ribazoletransferase
MAAVAIAAAAAVTVVAVRALGGVSGDVAGAVEQVAEIAGLLVASGLAARHGIWWR